MHGPITIPAARHCRALFGFRGAPTIDVGADFDRVERVSRLRSRRGRVARPVEGSYARPFLDGFALDEKSRATRHSGPCPAVPGAGSTGASAGRLTVPRFRQPGVYRDVDHDDELSSRSRHQPTSLSSYEVQLGVSSSPARPGPAGAAFTGGACRPGAGGRLTSVGNPDIPSTSLRPARGLLRRTCAGSLSHVS